MTGSAAAAVNPFAVSPVPALPPDTTPTAIRDALIDEERAEFERAYQEAIAEAAQALDLTRVLDVLRNYHRIAWLTQRQGPKAQRAAIPPGQPTPKPSSRSEQVYRNCRIKPTKPAWVGGECWPAAYSLGVSCA